MSQKAHRAGFVSIIGKPNVGKSTLMNQLVGEKLSIITSKAQTTRHRIMGIISGEDFQVIYSDTPGILNPRYELHRAMMKFVSTSLEDADLVLFVADPYEKYEDEPFIQSVIHAKVPVLLVINKTDLVDEARLAETQSYWEGILGPDETITVSALNGDNVSMLFERVLSYMPEHPAFYPKDEMTDKPERFFVAEIVREKILNNYKKEVPYSCQVVVEEFKEEESIIRMRVVIYVERTSQRGILLGHKGERIKKVGTEARADMEKFFGKKVFIEQHISVEPDWRKNANKLGRFGYN